MKLPNSDRAFVDIAKLRDYALDPIHSKGKHKARVFASALGLTRNDAEWLRDELLRVARESDCSLGQLTPHGQRYIQDFDVARGEKSCRIRSVWNIRPNEDFPRLITCFVI